MITLKNLILKNDEEVEHPLYVHLFNVINPVQLLVGVCARGPDLPFLVTVRKGPPVLSSGLRARARA